MNNKSTVWTALIVLFSLSFAFSGCDSPSVQVVKAQPEEAQIGAETLDMRNCDSLDELVTTLADEAPVREQISIPEQATVNETGTVIDIPSPMVTVIEEQIEQEYAPAYKTAVEQAEQEVLTIPGHMIHMYKILWMQKTYQSTLSLSIDNKPCTAFYTYTLEYPMVDSSTKMACTA